MFYLFYFVVVGQVQIFQNQKKKNKKCQKNKKTNHQTKLIKQITVRANLTSLLRKEFQLIDLQKTIHSRKYLYSLYFT